MNQTRKLISSSSSTTRVPLSSASAAISSSSTTRVPLSSAGAASAATVYINCSDVAAAINKNKFKSPKLVAESISRKLAMGNEDEEDESKVFVVEKLIATNKEVETRIKQLAKSKIELGSSYHQGDKKDEQEKNIQQVSKEIFDLLNNNNIDNIVVPKEELKVATFAEAKKAEEDFQEIKNLVKNQISMKTGVLSEEKIVDSLEKDVGVKIDCRNNTMKYRQINLPQIYFGRGKILVGGKVDGLITNDDGTVTVTEVKNRQNRLFRSVPIYEMIQVQVYMWLFRAQKCLFREHYHGDSWSTTIDYDPVMMESIQRDLIQFTLDHKLLFSESLIKKTNF
jgi:hypothetical protein